jgi:glycosyltransferase involved in cell wall biosynthesis
VLASVLIANRNYGRYVGRAIESALAQDATDVEVVVVDDGSSDDSADVLRSYRDRVTVVLGDHRGQQTAINDAFARSHGDVICLLDADDWFTPGKVAAVVEAFRRRPDAVLVHHQMQSVDAGGRPRDRPWPGRLLEGDLHARVARSGGWYPRAPASGLSFRRAYLERLFPIPSEHCRASGPLGEVAVRRPPDTYLAAPAAFVAPIAGIARPLSAYRIHGANTSNLGYDAVDRAAILNARIARCVVEFHTLRWVLLERYGLEPPIRLEDHLEYQLARHAVGALPTAAAVRLTLGSRALPAAMKPREAARVALGRNRVRGRAR